jgi:hypothetical protein
MRFDDGKPRAAGGRENREDGHEDVEERCTRFSGGKPRAADGWTNGGDRHETLHDGQPRAAHGFALVERVSASPQ